MRKIIFLAIIFFLTAPLGGVNLAWAQGLTADKFINYGAPEIDILPGEFDKLALDAVIPDNLSSGSDILKAITLQNGGSAYPDVFIKKVKLWADKGVKGFQGMGVDKELGEGVWHSGTQQWYLKNINQSVPPEGLRIFVSVESAYPIERDRRATVFMKIPVYEDADHDSLFDEGDKGVFLASGQNGPIDAPVQNPYTQIIRYSAYDTQPPKAVITDPAGDIALSVNSYTITGLSRDQGASATAWVKIGINDVWQEAAATSGDYLTWEYQWANIADGAYKIKVQSADKIGNVSKEEEVLTMTVSSQPKVIEEFYSARYSSVEYSPKSQKADGLSRVLLEVWIRNKDNMPVLGEKVVVRSLRSNGDQITIISDSTDLTGKVSFNIRSQNAGLAELSITCRNLSWVLRLPFIEPERYSKEGALVKEANKKAVYLLEDGAIRPMPSEAVFYSWGYQWKDVAVKNLYNMPLGAPVKFRDGYLIKGSDDRVYAVGEGGKKFWIINADVFTGLGYKWEKINLVSDEALAGYADGGNLYNAGRHPNGALIKYADSDKVYVLAEGKKQWIANPEEFLAGGWRWKDIITIPASEIYDDYL